MNLYITYKNNNSALQIFFDKLGLNYLIPIMHQLFDSNIHDDKEIYTILQEYVLLHKKNMNEEKLKHIDELANEFSYRKSLNIAKYIQHLKLKINTYLDIGTGDGVNPTTIMHKLNLNEKKIYCTDVPDNEFNFTFKGQCKYTIFDGRNLPYEDNFFDLITCFMVLHHVKYLDDLLINIKRVLKNGGYLLIREHDSNKNIKSFLYVEHDVYNYLVDNNSIDDEWGKEYSNFMSFDKLKNIIENIGFKLIRKDNKQFKNNIGNNYYALYQLSK